MAAEGGTAAAGQLEEVAKAAAAAGGLEVGDCLVARAGRAVAAAAAVVMAAAGA